MRHRMVTGTGLGNPSAELMNNSGKLPQNLLKEATTLFFSNFGGCDYEVKDDGIMIGIEPAYQHGKLKLVFIASDKQKSFIEYGWATGYYGSGIVSKKRYYKDYKYKTKFTNFIDKWSKS